MNRFPFPFYFFSFFYIAHNTFIVSDFGLKVKSFFSLFFRGTKGCFLFTISARACADQRVPLTLGLKLIKRACGDQRAPKTLDIVFFSLIGNSITDFSVKSSVYSHSWHMNQSVSVHWSASSRVMRSSSLQPQQDTITSSVITRPLSIGWIISLVLSLITGNSIAQSPQKSTLNFTFFCFFLSPYCDPVSVPRGPAWAVIELFF